MNTYSFDFESQFLVETFQENFLLVASKGLCVERLFYKHLQLYSDPSVLVLVLNMTKADMNYFSHCLEDDKQSRPRILTSEIATGERKMMYLEGGVQFVTTRILISDLLCDRVPVDLVSGFLIYRAHTVLKSALESFVLSTCRKNKSKAFVKAFSDAPQAFVEHFGQLQRAVTALGVQRVIFLPRYHVDVVKNLDACGKPKLVELAVKLTPSMKIVQNCLTEMIGACVQELRRCQILNFATDDQEISLEYALLPWFEDSLRRRLEQVIPNENLPTKVTRLLDDISRLRQLLNDLEIEDGKSFAKNFEAIRNDPYEHRNNSGWLFTSACEKMFETCKKRLDEVPTKWDALKTVLFELRANKSVENMRLVIVASEELVCQRLKDLIFTEKSQAQASDEEGQDEESWLPSGSAVELGYEDVKVSKPSRPEAFVVHFIPLLQRYSILRCLDKFEPDCVILYNADVWVIRQLETYSAVRMSENFDSSRFTQLQPLRVFFLMYDNSVEEQRYLTSLQQERTNFEKLFKEETNLLLKKDYTDEDVQDWSQFPSGNSGREIGSADEQTRLQPTIIVDMREFRSELPTLLHSRGAHLLPATLLVGDYVLSPQICVERKAPQDLIASLQSGRLLAQCQAMCQYYERPMLLIEMTSGRKGWRRFDDRLSAAKLAVLAATFPRLRFMWATSPSSAAELFLHLKFKRDEPDLDKAVAIGKDETSEESNQCSASQQIFNSAPRRLLAALPQITSKNIHKLFRKTNGMPGDQPVACDNFRHFCGLNEDQFSAILESSKIGARLRSFIEQDCRINNVAAVNKDATKLQKQPVRLSRKRK